MSWVVQRLEWRTDDVRDLSAQCVDGAGLRGGGRKHTNNLLEKT